MEQVERYELMLDKAEVGSLLEHFNELSPNVRFGVRMCQFDLETCPLCTVYPDIACMVEVVRVLGYIPRHVHVALATALRADIEEQAHRLTTLGADAATAGTAEQLPLEASVRPSAY